jgi:hypothetical protein
MAFQHNMIWKIKDLNTLKTKDLKLTKIDTWLKLINIEKITIVGHGRPLTFKLDMTHIQITTSNGNIFTSAYFWNLYLNLH